MEKITKELGRHKCQKFTYNEFVIDKTIRCSLLIIWKKLVGPMRSKNLSKLL